LHNNSTKDLNPVPINNDTSFEREKLSETMTKRRSRGGESKPEPTCQPHQPKAKPKKSAVSNLEPQEKQSSNPPPSESPATLKPKQMSIMAFVQKKKEEALEKRVSGYLSPASEASLEEDEVIKPKGDSNPKPPISEVKSLAKTPIVEASKDLPKIKKAGLTIEKSEVTTANLSRNERLAVYEFDKFEANEEIVKKTKQKMTPEKEDFVKTPKQKAKSGKQEIAKTPKQKLKSVNEIVNKISETADIVKKQKVTSATLERAVGGSEMTETAKKGANKERSR